MTCSRTSSTGGSCTATRTGFTGPDGQRIMPGWVPWRPAGFDAEHALSRALEVVSYGFAHDLLRSPEPGGDA